MIVLIRAARGLACGPVRARAVRARAGRAGARGIAERNQNVTVIELAESAYPIQGVVVHVPSNPPVLARMAAHRLVLAMMGLTILVATALAAALADFGGQGLDRAVHRDLASASGTSVAVSGALKADQGTQGTAAVRSAMRLAFGGAPFALYGATWSDALDLPGSARGAKTVPQVQAASLSGLQARGTLLSGSWPGPPAGGQPVPAALPARAVSLLHVATGDVITTRDTLSGKPVLLRVTGIYAARDPASGYWGLDLIGPDGQASAGGFTTYGPLVVNPAAFRDRLTSAAASWAVLPDTARLTGPGLDQVAARLLAADQALQNPAGPLGGLRVTTSLPAVLRRAASEQVVARSLVLIGMLELLILGGAALAAAARLLADQRETELGLLASRGGARWQLAALGVVEPLLIAAVAAAAGAAAGGPLARLLARTGSAGAGGPLISGTPAPVWLALVAVATLGTLLALAPALRPNLPGLARVRRGRRAAVSQVIRAGADAALIALAALAVWQIRAYSVISWSPNGTFGIDPVLAAAPALALAAGTLVLLRLLPLAARTAERAAGRRRLPGAMAVWQFSRRPLRQAGPALLVVLAVATGMLALSQHQIWIRSVQDQAAFDAGAPVRVDAQLPLSPALVRRIATAPGVRAAMPVARFTEGQGAQALAVDAGAGARTALLQPGTPAEPARALFAAISPAARPGLPLPGHPGPFVITASLGPASLRLGRAPVAVSVQYSDGETSTLQAGALVADGRPQRLTVDLGQGGTTAARLLAITVSYRMPARPPGRDAVLSVGAITVPAGHGAGRAVTLPGSGLARWSATASSPDLTGLTQAAYSLAIKPAFPRARSWQPAGAAGQALTFAAGSGTQATPAGPAPVPGLVTLTARELAPSVLPAIATRSYLSSGNLTLGSTVPLALDGVTVSAKIVAAVAAFPTVTGAGGALVVDLASLQDALVGLGQQPAPVTELWLAAPSRPAALPGGTAVVTRTGLAAALLGDPLSALPQQALVGVALGAALLALAGFAVSVAASVTERRPQGAVLSALGVSRAGQAWQLCLEELLLSGPAAVVGLALGAASVVLLAPSITRIAGAGAPAVTGFAWAAAIPLSVVVAVLPVLMAALAMLHRPDAAAQLRMLESG
jgi:hypothetical protein